MSQSTLVPSFLSSYLFLDGQFHLNPLGVGLRPQEAGIDKPHLENYEGGGNVKLNWASIGSKIQTTKVIRSQEYLVEQKH